MLTQNVTPPQRGFTMIELVVAVCIVAITAAVLLGKLRFYQEAAEKAAMQQTVSAIQSALTFRVAEMILRSELDQADGLARENPMAWLARQPPNYAGERVNPMPDEVAPGSWYFDPSDRTLVYVPNLGAHFKPGNDGRKRARYRVNVVYNRPQAEGAPPTPRDIGGVVIVPVEPVRWNVLRLD